MQEQFDTIIQHLEVDLATYQVGRALPSIVDRVMVEAYDSKMPLIQLASISSQDAQTLMIQPWDQTLIKAIEKALYASAQGFIPTIDGNVIKLHFPPFTEEKRRSLVKVMYERCEEAHVAIKRQREELLNHLKKRKKDEHLSEDTFFSEQKQIQKLVDDYNAKVNALAEKKERALMNI